MKKNFIPLMLGCMICFALPEVKAQEFNDHISKNFTPRKPAASTVLAVYNLSGQVRVESYSGDKVIMEIDEKITAKTDAQLERGKKEVKMVFEQSEDTILFYIAEPYDTRPNREQRKNIYDDRDIKYNYKLEFVLKVPAAMNLDVSTVIDGDVDIMNVSGRIQASNVTGSIKIANARNVTNAHTVTGNVTVNYLENPKEESSYYALTGNVRVTYAPDLSADMQFKTMNGNFYTDFNNAQVLPPRITKNKEEEGGGTTYKLGNSRDVRIGTGGKIYKFETLTGNVYIKKQS